MSLTWIGYVVLPLSVLAGIVWPNLPFALLAFFSIFSATAAANFPTIPFGLQPYHVFGFWVLTIEVTNSIWRLNVPCPRPIRPGINAAIIFVGVVAISIAARWGKISGTNLAQLVHLGFGVSIAWAISAKASRNPRVLLLMTRGFVAGALFATAWGLYQFVCELKGYEYPSFLFNNSVGNFAAGFGAGDAGGFPKISSVATEASFLARCLVIALALVVARAVVVLELGRKLRLALITNAFVLLIGVIWTTSSTGYVGLVALTTWMFMRLRRGRVLIAGSLAIIAGILGFAIVENEQLRAALIEATLGKFYTFSFLDRLNSVEQGWEAFLSNPVFGEGLGTITVHALLVKLLADVGIAGLLAFLILLRSSFTMVRRNKTYHEEVRYATASATSTNEVQRLPAWAFGLAFAVSIMMDFVSGFSYTYGHMWIILGMLWGAIARDAHHWPKKSRLANQRRTASQFST